MSIETVPEAIALIANGTQLLISGKTYTLKAFDPPPPKLDTPELPALYVLSGNADDGTILGAQTIDELRTYRVQVAILTLGEGSAYNRETFCRPWIAKIKNLFHSHPGLRAPLSPTLFVHNSRVLSDTGVVVLPEFDGQFIGFEMRLQVEEVIPRTYASAE